MYAQGEQSFTNNTSIGDLGGGGEVINHAMRIEIGIFLETELGAGRGGGAP